MNGKGDTPRPCDRARYAAGYDAIRWRSRTRCDDCGKPIKRRQDEKCMEYAEGRHVTVCTSCCSVRIAEVICPSLADAFHGKTLCGANGFVKGE